MSDENSNEICSQTINAGGCVVLVPGLLAAIANATATTDSLSGNLARLLGFAAQIKMPEAELTSVEALVADIVLPKHSGSSAAYFTCMSDYPPSTLKKNTVMRADPAYQQIDMNNATLGNPLELELTLEECTSLQQTLNQHFAQDGIRFQCKDPHRWYCHFDSPLQVTTTPASASIGRDVASVKPTGKDARRWRSKLAEIEMLLFEHPVNIARQENNNLPVNTLWIWGEGSPMPDGSVPDITIYSDNFYTHSVSKYLGLECNELPVDMDAFKPTDESALIVIDKFTLPDFLSSDNNLKWFDEIISDQLWSRLQASGWPEVTLWLGDHRLFTIQASVKRQVFKRLFKKPKPLSAYLSEAELSMAGMPMDESMQAAQQPNDKRVW